MSYNEFTKDNLDTYLKELAKEYRKLTGKKMPPAEIILVGGAAVMANYRFRDATEDIDAAWNAASTMKEAINRVGDRFGLKNKWFNDDFTKVESCSRQLARYAVPYKRFYGVFDVYTVHSEYLIAMKLHAWRDYKHDQSDVIGILAEHEMDGEPIALEAIDAAVTKLYGGWESFPKDAKAAIEDIFAKGNYEAAYRRVKADEAESKDELVAYEKEHPNVVNQGNARDVSKALKARRTGTPRPRPDRTGSNIENPDRQESPGKDEAAAKHTQITRMAERTSENIRTTGRNDGHDGLGS